MRKIVQIIDTIQKDLPNLNFDNRQTNLFIEYFKLLHQWNKKINLTAIRDPDDMLVKHLLDTLTVCYLNDRHQAENLLEGTAIDFGSGAGIPGILLAISYPLLMLTSVDKSKKKIAFQQEVVRRLKLTNVKTSSERLEILTNHSSFKNTFDLIITRAFDQIKEILPLGDRFLGKEGKLILWKGKKWQEELKQVDDNTNQRFKLLDVHDYYFKQFNIGGSLLLFQKQNKERV